MSRTRYEFDHTGEENSFNVEIRCKQTISLTGLDRTRQEGNKFIFFEEKKRVCIERERESMLLRKG